MVAARVRELQKENARLDQEVLRARYKGYDAAIGKAGGWFGGGRGGSSSGREGRGDLRAHYEARQKILQGLDQALKEKQAVALKRRSRAQQRKSDIACFFAPRLGNAPSMGRKSDNFAASFVA